MNDCQCICLTPTRNESWIIDKFVAAAKTWADHVIVADQGSTDGTWERLANLPKVKPVRNENPVFDENQRQNLLLSHARQISGKRILFGLDADEVLSSSCRESKEWELIAQAKPGTILRFRWINILPGFKEAWIPPNLIPCGFVDDGSEHSGRKIHSPRVPNPPGAPFLDLKEIAVVHFQYVLWERMASKHRWYQAWEYAKHKEKGALRIFREYNHMYGSWDRSEIYPVQPEWLAGYTGAGIDFSTLKPEPVTWWDKEVVQMLREYGPTQFRKIALWDKDWNAVAAKVGVNGADLNDPRSSGEKLAHRLLKASQNHRSAILVRALEHLLRRFGW